MSKNKELLSSFMDGQELSAAQLEALINDVESAKDFERFHTIGDAMRDELAPAFSTDFASKVSAAIELEPAILAPKTAVNTTDEKVEKPSGNVVSLFGRFGSYGIAASVAAVMVVSAIQLQSNQTAEQDIPVLQTMPTGGYASPVSQQFSRTSTDVQQQMTEEERMAVERKMNAYIKDHLLQQRLKASSPQKDK
ncbi:anti-sigma factor [Psychrobium sp. MM17-31]|uniref:sigma-E factor negative regulatory protein n=1 Tax=Psychrobium sp. MM17-31 TaxID=2917758 RepID=UPI001EF5E949|nr:anti-sigma factor [Psychrobium sp. MM17-31]